MPLSLLKIAFICPTLHSQFTGDTPGFRLGILLPFHSSPCGNCLSSRYLLDWLKAEHFFICHLERIIFHSTNADSHQSFISRVNKTKLLIVHSFEVTNNRTNAWTGNEEYFEMLAKIPYRTLYAWYLKLLLGAEDEGLSKMKNYWSDCTSSSHFTSDGRQVEVLDVYSWYVKMKVSSLNAVGIPVIKAVYTCMEHISRDNSYCWLCNHFFLVGVYLFWQIACLCVFSKTKQNPSIFSYCVCSYFADTEELANT